MVHADAHDSCSMALLAICFVQLLDLQEVNSFSAVALQPEIDASNWAEILSSNRQGSFNSHCRQAV